MSEPTRHRAFKFGMWHQQVNLCQVCANYATGAKNGHSRGSHVLYRFIAHLIRRLIGELIVYQSLRRPSAHQHFQTSLKPLGQFSSDFIWRLLRMGERKFVQMVLVT